MSRLALAALAAATLTSVVALTDAAALALTGEGSVFTAGPAWATQLANAVHGATAVALVAVLLLEADRIDAGSAARRWVRRALATLLAVPAVPYLLSAVVTEDRLPDLSAATGPAFLLAFPLASALGLMLLRREGFTLPGTLLALTGAGLAAAVVLGALGSPWAHPAYAEVLLCFGIALLAPGAATTRPARVPAGARAS